MADLSPLRLDPRSVPAGRVGGWTFTLILLLVLGGGLGGLLIASAVWIVLLRRFSEESETRWREHTAQLELRIAELSAETNGRAPARIRPVRTAKKTAS